MCVCVLLRVSVVVVFVIVFSVPVACYLSNWKCELSRKYVFDGYCRGVLCNIL